MVDPTSSSGSVSAPLVFSFAFETWADAARGGTFSGHMFAKYLVDSPAVSPLLVADPLRSVLGLLRGRTPDRFPETADRHHVSPRRLRKNDSTRYRATLRAHRRYLAKVRSAAVNAGMTRPPLIVTHPFTAAAAAAADWGSVIYYGWDDWLAHPAYRAWWPALDAAYRDIRLAGHNVVGVTKAIVERIDSPGRRLVLPNGLDPQEWRRPSPPPTWFAGVSRPKVLYCGTINSRIDVDAVTLLAREMPEARIVLVGEIADRNVAEQFADVANVQVRPREPREVVRGLVFDADVAVIPHVVNDLTKAMSPLKLYEYLAAGKPVVAIDLEPVRAVGGSLLYRSPGEFVSQVRSALNQPPTSEAARLAFIDENSWSSRFDQLVHFALT